MLLLKPLLLTESKQSIINLGYPPIIADLFYQKFGNDKAFLLSKWFKDYHNYLGYKDWWKRRFSGFGKVNVDDYIQLYYATFKDQTFYFNMLDNMGLSHDKEVYDLEEERKEWKKEITEEFFKDIFFQAFNIILDIMSGKLKDLKPYENLKFLDAETKYDEKRIFKETKPIKTYDNGWFWVNVGKRCHLMGHYMKNCGSAGVMSSDKDRTIIGLFDNFLKPHIMITYSPNEKRISGEEGVGSTNPKDEYHDYILDLSKILGAKFDVGRSKSPLLILKYMLGNKMSNIKRLKNSSSVWTEFFQFIFENKIYFSNGYDIVSRDDVKKVISALKNKSLDLHTKTNNILRDIFDYRNKDILKNKYVTYIDKFNFQKEL